MGEENKQKMKASVWGSFSILWVLWAVNSICRELINRLSPAIIASYHLDSSQLGYLTTIAQIAMSLGSIPITMWAEKGGAGWKRKKRGIIVAICYMTAAFLMGLAGKYLAAGVFSVFMILNTIRAFFSAADENMVVGMMQEWCPVERRGFFIGLHHTGYPWGVMLSGLICTIVLNIGGENSWQILYMLFPVIGVMMWGVWYHYSSERRYDTFVADTVAHGLTPPLDEESTDETASKTGGIGRILKNPIIMALAITAFLHNFIYAGINFWLTPFLTFVAGQSAASAASLSVIFTITGGLGQIVWGVVSDKWGDKRVLQVGFIWLAIAFMMFLFCGGNLTVVILLEILFGFAISGMPVVIYKMIGSCAEPGKIPLTLSVTTFFMYFGGAIATTVIGKAIEIGGGWTEMSGYMTGIMLIAGAAVAVVVIVTLFTRELSGPRAGKDFSLLKKIEN